MLRITKKTSLEVLNFTKKKKKKFSLEPHNFQAIIVNASLKTFKNI